jgi:hypothetical protein
VKKIETTKTKREKIIFSLKKPPGYRFVPSGVLSQVGLKIQHALRAFTANDRKAIKMTAENYPLSDFYTTDELITQLGIGEALITGLNEKGIPTPLAAVMLNPPCSRMNVLTETELNQICEESELSKKYNQEIDERSAYEILSEKLNRAVEKEESESEESEVTVERKSGPREKSTLEEILSSPVTKQVARTATQVLTRTLLGALGVSSSSRKKKSSWF